MSKSISTNGLINLSGTSAWPPVVASTRCFKFEEEGRAIAGSVHCSICSASKIPPCGIWPASSVALIPGVSALSRSRPAGDFAGIVIFGR